MDNITAMAKSVIDKWNSLDKKKKIFFIAGVLAVFLLSGVIVYILNKPTYVSLYNEQLDYQTSGAVQEILTANGIKFKPTNGDQTILIDQKNVGKARIAISTEELPNSKYTWKDALNKNTMGLTESEKNANFKYAKEQELASAIANIDGVRSAVVNLTLPPSDTLLAKKTTASQAGIQLDLSKTLAEKQINGIAQFVMTSVEGLTKENISITDTNANILFTSDSETLMTSGYDEIEREKEAEMEKRVEAILKPLFDDIKVTANLKVNFDKYKETRETVSSPIDGAKTGLIYEEHTKKDQTTNQTSGGEPGYGSNDEDTSYQLEDNGTNSSASSESKDTYYKLNTVLSELEKRVGDVVPEESSISVVVYKNQVHDYNELNKKKTFKEVSWREYKENMKTQALTSKIEIDQDIIESIQRATGIQQIKVTGYVTPQFIEPIESEGLGSLLNLVPILILIGLIIGIVIILVKKAREVTIVETEPELSVESLLYSTREREPELPEIQEHVSETVQRLNEFIDTKPDLVAQLLRSWLNED